MPNVIQFPGCSGDLGLDEKDGIIARKVMGWRLFDDRKRSGYWFWIDPYHAEPSPGMPGRAVHSRELFQPTQEFSSAHRVLEQLTKLHGDGNIVLSHERGVWTAFSYHDPVEWKHRVSAPTMPLAISNYALLLLNEGVRFF